jgi:hypothetical protein
MPVMMLTNASSAPRSFDGSYSMSTRSSSTASLFTYRLCKVASQSTRVFFHDEIIGAHKCCSNSCWEKQQKGRTTST